MLLRKLLVGSALVCAWTIACSESSSDDAPGGTADAGASGDGAGGDGTGGKGASGGSGGSSGRGTAGGKSGGTGKGGTDAGAAGDGATGAATGDAGAGGSSGTSGRGGTAGTPPDNAGTGGDSGEAGAAGTGGGDGCTTLTVGTGMYFSDIADAPNFTSYVYLSNPLGGASPDYLEVMFYSSNYNPIFDGELKGPFQLGTGIDANFNTCGRCVVVEEDYAGTVVNYFATAGTLTVAQDSGQMIGSPNVALTDVTLREVTIDSNSVSTLVPNGRCLHLAAATVQIPVAWSCSDTSYATDDGCDCGCGALDSDCSDANASSCTTCHCTGNTSDCTAVSTADNAVCTI